jgi:asparagine synthase (glutamine-hydrolysing)
MARRAYLTDYGGQSDQERYLLRVSNFARSELESLYAQNGGIEVGRKDPFPYLKQFFQRTGGLEYLDATDYVTIKTYLPEDILTKVDRMTMAVSLEARCPLLDHHLAEFVARLPLRLKTEGNTLKGLLKRTAMRHNLVPRQTVIKAKHGFGAPIDYWMKRQWRDMTSSILSTERSKTVRDYFDGTSLKKMLADPMTYRDHLFAVMAFVLWHEQFVEMREKMPYEKIRL